MNKADQELVDKAKLESRNFPLPKHLWEIRGCDKSNFAVSMYEHPKGTRWWDKISIDDIEINIKEK